MLSTRPKEKIAKFDFFVVPKQFGWMSEWFKVSVLKTEVSNFDTGGSNPSPSDRLNILGLPCSASRRSRPDARLTTRDGRLFLNTGSAPAFSGREPGLLGPENAAEYPKLLGQAPSKLSDTRPSPQGGGPEVADAPSGPFWVQTHGALRQAVRLKDARQECLAVEVSKALCVNGALRQWRFA